MLSDDLIDQSDLRGVSIDNLDLLILQTENEVTTFGWSQRIYSEPELTQIILSSIGYINHAYSKKMLCTFSILAGPERLE